MEVGTGSMEDRGTSTSRPWNFKARQLGCMEDRIQHMELDLPFMEHKNVFMEH